MDWNKGRLIPNLNSTDVFINNPVRSPFEGELAVDDDDDLVCFLTNNIGVMEAKCRTKEIQAKIDEFENSGILNDALAYIENDTIHRIYYDKSNLKCWLDKSYDFSMFSYYAVKSIKKINGKQLYVTGENPHDGLKFENALIPISQNGTLCFEMLPNIWYTVEFFNSNKKCLYSLNYISFSSHKAYIDNNLKPDSYKTVENNKIRDCFKRVIDFDVRFDKEKNYGEAHLYEGQSVDLLKPKIISKKADGTLSVIENAYVSRREVYFNASSQITFASLIERLPQNMESEGKIFQYYSLDGINPVTTELSSTIIIGANEYFNFYSIWITEAKDKNRIKLNDFDKIDTSIIGDYKCSISYKYIESFDTNISHNIYHNYFNYLNQEYCVFNLNIDKEITIKTIKIKPVGSNDIKILEDDKYVVENGSIIILGSEFELGFNDVFVEYTYIIENPSIKISDFIVDIPLIVKVIENTLPKVVKIIPTAYLTQTGSNTYVYTIKIFAIYDNHNILDITDRIRFLNEPIVSFGNHTQVSIEYPIDSINSRYNQYNFTLYCDDPRISGNSNKVIINRSSRLNLTYFNGTTFSFAIKENGINHAISYEDLFEESELNLYGTPEYIKVRSVLNTSKMYLGLTRSNDRFDYIDKKFITIFDYNKSDNDINFRDYLANIVPEVIEDYEFIGFSFDGENVIQQDDTRLDTIFMKGAMISVNGNKPGFLYIKKSSSISLVTDNPVLIEGFRRDDSGKYLCTGALVSYATRI